MIREKVIYEVYGGAKVFANIKEKYFELPFVSAQLAEA